MIEEEKKSVDLRDKIKKASGNGTNSFDKLDKSVRDTRKNTLNDISKVLNEKDINFNLEINKKYLKYKAKYLPLKKV